MTRITRALAILGAALAGLAVGCSPGSPASLAPSSSSAGPPSSSTAATAGTTPNPSAVTTDGTAIPILTVEQASAIRDNGTGAGPIAIRGWYGEINMPSCGPYRGVVDRLEWQCPPLFAALMAGPEQLTTVTGNGGSGHQPTGASLEVRFAEGTQRPSNSVDSGADMGAPPLQIVAIGNFRDPRAIFCQETARADCQRYLVIEEVLGPDGTLVAPTVDRLTSKSGRQSPPDVLAAAVAAHAGWTPVSVAFVGDGTDMNDSPAADVDPRLVLEAWPGSTDRGWLVRLVRFGSDAAPITVFVDDADLSVRELPPWPSWDLPAAAGLGGADPVAPANPDAAARCTSDSATLTGGVFIRVPGSSDLWLASPGARVRVLANPATPLFVRGTGGDTTLLDDNGAVLAHGMVQVTGCPTSDAAGAPLIFRKVGFP